jgi:putative ATP-dependent endonuclease of OLD family
MHIERILIIGYKKFRELDIPLRPDINIIVGDNEAGKSTILESIDICLSGLISHRYIRNEISQALFNRENIDNYLASLGTDQKTSPPFITIELHLGGEGLEEFQGDRNYNKEDSCGLSVHIRLDERNNDLYGEWVQLGDYSGLPIELYGVFWETFARDRDITIRHIPLKSAYIDSTQNRPSNGNDLYISKMIKDMLEKDELIEILRAQRKANESFAEDEAIKKINKKIDEVAKVSRKTISIGVEQITTNAWDSGLYTYIDGIPFVHAGKGEQSIVKTKVAIAHRKAEEKNVLMIEEPENHLSYAKLNELLLDLSSMRGERQIIISTHSSFVANKLGLDSLILLGAERVLSFESVNKEDKDFFRKLAGYDTLRLLLCKKAILVEGDSDELIVQKAYQIANGGKLPIQDGIDIISVRTAFKRFLGVASLIDLDVCIVTDNDGHPERLEQKYQDYLSPRIKICYDSIVDSGELLISGKSFNYNSLEPKLVKENGRTVIESILGRTFENDDELHIFMHANKTECALAFFSTDKSFRFPNYILEAIR